MKKVLNAENYEELAKRFKLKSHNSVSNWLKEGRSIPEKQILKCVQMTNINKGWLLTGKEPMYENSASNNIAIKYFPEIYASAGNGIINYDEAQSVMSFDVEFLKKMLGITQFNNLHIINAIGDSMEPTFSNGMLLFISPIENENFTITSGGVYVVLYENEVFVKRMRRDPKTKEITLMSDNKTYPDISFEKEDLNRVHIIGRVLGSFEKLNK